MVFDETVGTKLSDLGQEAGILILDFLWANQAVGTTKGLIDNFSLLKCKYFFPLP